MVQNQHKRTNNENKDIVLSLKELGSMNNDLWFRINNNKKNKGLKWTRIKNYEG